MNGMAKESVKHCACEAPQPLGKAVQTDMPCLHHLNTTKGPSCSGYMTASQLGSKVPVREKYGVCMIVISYSGHALSLDGIKRR